MYTLHSTGNFIHDEEMAGSHITMAYISTLQTMQLSIKN